MIVPLFPMQTVLFPGATLSLHVFEPRYRELLKRCRHSGETFGIALIRAGHEVGGPAVPFDIGTEAAIVAVEDLPDGRANVLVEGRRRFRLLRTIPGKSYHEGEVEWLREDAGDAEDWRRTVLGLLPDAEAFPEEPVALSYRLAEIVAVTPAERQGLLEAPDAAERLKRESALLLRSRPSVREAS